MAECLNAIWNGMSKFEMSSPRDDMRVRKVEEKQLC